MDINGNDMTWSNFDLHVHTNASDGTDDPWGAVALAWRRGITVIAVVDHDTTAGLDEAMRAGRYFDVCVIPGIELSTEEDGREVHLLGFFIDHYNDDLQSELAKQRELRVHRARTMVEKLANLGLPVSWERLREIAGGSVIGRPHIAQALKEVGYVESIEEAFERLIGRGRPAYVSRPNKLTPIEGIKLVHRAGGVPVLAHPIVENGASRRRWSFPHLERLEDYRRAGLMGLEAYYSGYSPRMSRCLASVAQRHGLIVTGGSDYHGIIKPDHSLGGVRAPSSCVKGLITKARERKFQEVREAFQGMDEETYRLYERCRQPIDEERLVALPSAPLGIPMPARDSQPLAVSSTWPLPTGSVKVLEPVSVVGLATA